MVLAHAFDPSTWEAEAGGFLSSRTARATQRNPVSKEPPKKNLKKDSRDSPAGFRLVLGPQARQLSSACSSCLGRSPNSLIWPLQPPAHAHTSADSEAAPMNKDCMMEDA